MLFYTVKIRLAFIYGLGAAGIDT